MAKVAVAGALIGAATVSTACTGGTPAPIAAQASEQSQQLARAAAVRWWSNDAVTAGSAIDPTKPDSASGNLSPSEPQYCTMLSQTVAARKSILPTVTANDPALLTSTEAFVAELEQVAPAQVSAAWKVLGPAIVKLVQTRGQLPTKAEATALKKATATISAHAKQACGVDIAGKN